MLMQPWNPELIKHRSSLHEPATSSSRSQVAARTTSAVARPTWERPSVSIHWRPLLAMAIVTHLVTRSLACLIGAPRL